MRLLALSILTTSILIILLSCVRREGDVANVKPANLPFVPQLRSFSISGSDRALVLTGSSLSTRDLRLTTDGGKSWQVVRADKDGDDFTTAIQSEDGLTWAVSRRGRLFQINSEGVSWKLVSNVSTESPGDFMQAEQIEFPTPTD